MTRCALILLDRLFLLAHTALILFVLVGWIWPGSRRLHRWVVLLIAGSWFGLGLRYGIGYCPCTDWHWQIRRQLGDDDLPTSYIKFLLDSWFETSIGAQLVDAVTLALFLLVFALSNFLWCLEWWRERKVR